MGTIDIDANDPGLEGADAIVRTMYETSLKRRLVAKERPPGYPTGSRRKGRRG
jgi:hypothetical protein